MGERKGRRGVVKCGSFAKKRGGVGSVTAGRAGLGLRVAAEVAAGRRLAAHDDLRPRADQRVRRISVLQRRLEARAAVEAGLTHWLIFRTAGNRASRSRRSPKLVQRSRRNGGRTLGSRARKSRGRGRSATAASSCSRARRRREEAARARGGRSSSSSSWFWFWCWGLRTESARSWAPRVRAASRRTALHFQWSTVGAPSRSISDGSSAPTRVRIAHSSRVRPRLLH